MNAQNELNAEFLPLNILAAVPDGTTSHTTQYGTLTAGSKAITNLYFLKESGATAAKSAIVTGVDTTKLVQGEIVSGTGIPAGTTISSIDPNNTTNEIVLSNTATYTGPNTLTFSDPIIESPVFETGKITVGSAMVGGLVETTNVIGDTTQGGFEITNMNGTASSLAVGDTVSWAGISTAIITQILDPNTIVLSQAAGASASHVPLLISSPLAVGEAVSGPGIPAGTTIASVSPNSTSITLSSPATASAGAGTLTFGSLPFAGPLVSDAAGALPQGDSVTAVLSGNSVELSQAATKTESVALTFTLTDQENQQRLALDNTLQGIIAAENNALSQLGATTEIDFLQGGQGAASLYAGPKPVWMLGSSDANTNTTFYITPSNYANYSNDLVQGGKSSNDTLMFLGDGKITIGYDDASFSDIVTIPSFPQPLTWKEGHGVSTIGVQTMGGTDTVTINAPKSGAPKSSSADDKKLGAWTSAIKVVNGGFASLAGLHGNVTIDATAYTEIGEFIGGAGNDTVLIDRLSTAVNVGGTPIYTQIVGGTGNNQQNELDIIGDTLSLQVIEGLNSYTNQDDLQVNATWVGASGFQKLVVVGASWSGSPALDNLVNLSGGLIPQTVLEGGSGTGVVNDFTVIGGTNAFVGGSGGATNKLTATGGTNTFFGGQGTSTTNTMTAQGGTNTLFGGSGANTFNLSGTGTYDAIGGVGQNTFNLNAAGSFVATGGAGVNVFNVSGGSGSMTGGVGANTFNLVAAGNYTLIGGVGSDDLVIRGATYYDEIDLSQSGSTITIGGRIGGAAITATAANMTGVTAYGAPTGYNTLDASKMIMGVALIGQGDSNTLRGGEGRDTLDGGSGGYDDLYAGNDSDRLYISGSNSSYYGTGNNPLVFRAQPNDDLAMYAHGLLVNGQLTYATYSDGTPYYYTTGTYYHFDSLTGIGNFEIEDGAGNININGAGGNATFHYAQESEVPRSAYYTFPTSGGIVPLAQLGFDITGYGDKSWSGTVTTSSPSWITGAKVVWTYWNNFNSDNIQWGSWLTSSQWPFDQANDYGIPVTINTNLGYWLIWDHDGELRGYVELDGYPGVEQWSYQDYEYGQWANPLLPVVIDPGIHVTNLSAVATGSAGAVVSYPQTFTTGGASADPRGSLTRSRTPRDRSYPPPAARRSPSAERR